MIVISLYNNKGGTAKTTSTSSIGAILANNGHRVLLIDLDEQCNLTRSLTAGCQHSVYDALKKTINHLPIVPLGCFDIVCSSKNLNSIEGEIIHSIGREKILKKLLASHQEEYDFVLIDCPPAKNTLTLNALVASNYVLIPAIPELFAYDGVELISDLIGEVKENYNPEIRNLGVFLTQCNNKRILTKQIQEAINANVGGLLDSQIRIDVALPESQVQGKTILEYAPESNATKDYNSLVNEILERIKK